MSAATLPLHARRLEPGKVRVCKSPGGKFWLAERVRPIHDTGTYSLSTHTCVAFPDHKDALAQALSWLPKERTL